MPENVQPTNHEPNSETRIPQPQNSQQPLSQEQKPDNRLKDGTNDYQNGDQEPQSERSAK